MTVANTSKLSKTDKSLPRVSGLEQGAMAILACH
jgi:hypothetical protein